MSEPLELDGSEPRADLPLAKRKSSDIRYAAAAERRAKTLQLVEDGMPILEAAHTAGFSKSAYQKARANHRGWAAQLDVATGRGHQVPSYDGTYASFASEYFGHRMAWFHLLYLEELARMPPGNILLALFPPEHGKTTMFENYASQRLAEDPEERIIVAAANQSLARRIIGRVQKRMEPMGPTPKYVRDFGPFAPQFGTGRNVAQPWGADHFNVFKKATSDERDYSMSALGVGSEIIGSRPTHLHIDDPQSLKTLGKDAVRTPELVKWFRQDVLSRTGETGKVTIAGTRVGDGDFLETIMEDELATSGIMKIIKFPALITDPTTQTVTPLWAEKNSMEMMERIRIKSGQDVWDTQYMMTPNASKAKQLTTFSDIVEPCYASDISYQHRPTPGSICYIGLDPALGGKNCVMVVEVRPEGRLIVRRIQEKVGLRLNEEIFAEIEEAVIWTQLSGAKVTDVVIEAMNFQRGMARDLRLVTMSHKYNFALREHLTGINKYDENIGVPSMAASFRNREIVIPFADDTFTRETTEEFRRQLLAWRPFARGTKLRQDQVMVMWFVWILWQSRWKTVQTADDGQQGFNRAGLGSTSNTSLVLPIGYR